MKQISIPLFLLLSFSFSYAHITFTPKSLLNDNSFLFQSTEKINDAQINTFFQGQWKSNGTQFQALTFYPEYVIPHYTKKSFYLQNKLGCYVYDIEKSSITPISKVGSLSQGDEYTIFEPSLISPSPDGKFIVYKKNHSILRSDIYILDLKTGITELLVEQADRLQGFTSALWAPNSNHFIYQKNNCLYYFPIKEWKSKKLLNEDWRKIGNSNLKKTSWTRNGNLIWVEKNIVYRSNPEQFYYRSIYKHYLKQGVAISKIPFDFDPETDSLLFQDSINRFFVVKEGISISYYSPDATLTTNPYIQLSDTMRFDKTYLNIDGSGAFTVIKLENGKLKKEIIAIQNNNNEFNFIPITSIKGEILSINHSETKKEILVTTTEGLFELDTINIQLKEIYKSNELLSAYKTITGTIYLFEKTGISTFILGQKKLMFLASSKDGGYYEKNYYLEKSGEYFLVDSKTGRVNEQKTIDKKKLEQNTTNGTHRLFERNFHQGLYRDILYIKELYSGKQFEITPIPSFNYALSQPEITGNFDFIDTPHPKAYEIALLFDCVKTSEGVFNILTLLDKYKIKANFFINGEFMEINPQITKEISRFNVEIGNSFQYNVNLLENKFMVDKNFIRQGLSANEESYFAITNKNFSPYWHTPNFVYSDSIIRYGLESGYRYVTYNLDSFDWVDKTDQQLLINYSSDNEKIIEQIIKKLKPNQTILLSTGKNHASRDNWLFYDLEYLIAEMMRHGYTFTFVSNVLDKYRQ